MTKWAEKLHNLDPTEAKEFILGQSSTVEEVFLSHQHPLVLETTSELDVCNNTVSKSPTSPKGAAEVFDFGTDRSGPNCYQVFLSSVVVIGVTCFIVVLCRDLIKDILVWLASVHIGVSIVIFLLLYILVSYPMAWGMILLMIACGYLYGYIYGPLVVELCSAFGIAVAHLTMKTMCRSFIIRKFYNEKMTAVINVVGGKHGFKVVALTRLTPIPFGLQNSLFSVSIVLTCHQKCSPTWPECFCMAVIQNGKLPIKIMIAGASTSYCDAITLFKSTLYPICYICRTLHHFL